MPPFIEVKGVVRKVLLTSPDDNFKEDDFVLINTNNKEIFLSSNACTICIEITEKPFTSK